ncbi:hypothetical protein [Pyrococcus yayanosii]|uniref:Uncharacterized protein n=1 Tax=Pyrococcus yayanosii (strain CH1 / JCM 16557) TaxID=529709 RepID=F8AGI5_PYRYC|nr:hypothetical protein [Pyrococcus yayanosii]AEH25187.1 hypothetical protein PYCH_15210 [Pyrococcus yayanosii CH1]
MKLFEKEFWDERRKHRENIMEYLNAFIENPTKENLKSLIGEIWALRFTYRNFDWYIEDRVLKYVTLEELAKDFKMLVDESLPIGERLKKKIPGFGAGAISEILFARNPNKYPVYNRKFLEGAQKLGYRVEHVKQIIRLSKGTLEDLVTINERIASDFSELWRDIEGKLGIKIPKFDFTDGLLWNVATGEVTPRELVKWRKSSSEINAEFANEISKALIMGLRMVENLIAQGEDEGKAIEKASAYVAGMLMAFGIRENGDTIVELLERLSKLAEKSAKVIKSI